MVEISIISLIYKSSKLAEAIYESLYKHTPKLKNGEAEFFFVANDPTEELVEFLDSKGYPYIINANDHLSDKELYKLGYGTPEYMRRVYQGYNQGILNAKGQKVVLINSDNFFSEDWLENLLKYSDYKKVVCSTLVEPGHDKFGVFPCAIHKNFGRTTEDYQEEEFMKFASKISKTGYTSGGAYMPCLLYKDIAVLAGLYPEGNIAGKDFSQIKSYGDENFYEKLKGFGVDHITAKDSIVYHLKEGEKSEALGEIDIVSDVKYKRLGLNDKYTVTPTNLINYIRPETKHLEIIESLGKKYTAIVMHYWSLEELKLQVEQIQKQTVENVEIVVLHSDKKFVGKPVEDVKYIQSSNEMRHTVLYDLLHKIHGEYLIVTNPQGIYESDMFEKVIEKDAIYHIGPEAGGDSEDVVDSIGNFIIPKGVLLRDINSFITPILKNSSLEINLKKQRVIPIPTIEIANEGNAMVTPKYKKSVPYRILRKAYREGPRGVAKSALRRINKKHES